jgi:hypothetical protein
MIFCTGEEATNLSAMRCSIKMSGVFKIDAMQGDHLTVRATIMLVIS